jgi:hypothetical protein
MADDRHKDMDEPVVIVAYRREWVTEADRMRRDLGRGRSTASMAVA